MDLRDYKGNIKENRNYYFINYYEIHSYKIIMNNNNI